MTPGAYVGKILKVDLGSGRVQDMPLPAEDVLRKYLGCFGLGLRFLYDMLPPGYQPTDPENPLIFMTGPLTGLRLPCANQLTLTTKNADTGYTVGRTHTHGFLGPRLKFAGYDGVIFTGKAASPVYLWIHDGKAEIREANSLWGKDTHETEDLIKEEVGQADTSVAAIGPAGENLCCGALIANDRNHTMAHAGGVVMGSKKLKAFAISSKKRSIPTFDNNKLDEVEQKWNKLVTGPKGIIVALGKGGIVRSNYEFMQGLTGVSSHNWRKQLPEFGQGFSSQKITPRGCWSCPIACCYDAEAVSGPHKGYVSTLCGGGEALEAAAGLFGISEPGTVFYLTDLLDRLGVDGSTAGCTISMAIEAYEKGLLTKEMTGGLELRWQDPVLIETLIRKYAAREDFGDLLANGPKLAALMIGGDAPNFAIHVKGAGIPLHDWRPMWGKLCSVILSGGSGQPAHAADSTKAEPDAGYPERTPGNNPRGKAKEIKDTGPHKWYQDSIGVCWFGAMGLPGMADIVADALSAATGWDYTRKELLETGERIAQLERVFNVRHGLRPNDDLDVGRRIIEPQVDGPAKGKALGPYLEGIMAEYYALMGWDLQTGKPFRNVLKAVGLEKESRHLWGNE